MFNTKPVGTRAEGLQNLLKAFGVKADGWVLEQNAIVLESGTRVPLLSHRTFFHTGSLRSFTYGASWGSGSSTNAAAAHTTALKGPSHFRLQYAGSRSEGLNAMLKRELDMCEFLLGAKTVHVFAMANGDVLHVSARMSNGVVATYELNASLPEGTPPVFKRELTTKDGFVTDRAVDTQITPENMYLINSEGVSAYNEIDALTYGLSKQDTIDVRAAFSILKGDITADEYIDDKERLYKLCALVWKAAQTGERVDTQEVNN